MPDTSSDMVDERKLSESSDKAKSIDTRFSDISTMVNHVAGSSEIRPDVVKFAQNLINDPQWLNDSNLENLANKITEIENF